MADGPDGNPVMQQLLLDNIGQSIVHLRMLTCGTYETETREIKERIANGGDWSGELWIYHPAGRGFPVHATITTAHGRRTNPVDRKHNEAVLRREAVGLTTRYAEDFESEVKASIAIGKFVTGLEVRWSRKNGTVIKVELTVSPAYGQGGDQAGVSVIAQDIAEIQRLRAAAAVEREKLLAAQEMAHVGSVEHTMETGETWHSKEFRRIFSPEPGQVALPELMLELTHPEDRELVQRILLGLDMSSLRLDRNSLAVVKVVDLKRFKLTNDGTTHMAGDNILVLLGRRRISSGTVTAWAASAGMKPLVCENLTLRGAKTLPDGSGNPQEARSRSTAE